MTLMSVRRPVSNNVKLTTQLQSTRFASRQLTRPSSLNARELRVTCDTPPVGIARDVNAPSGTPYVTKKVVKPAPTDNGQAKLDDPHVNQSGLHGTVGSGLEGLQGGAFGVASSLPISYEVRETEGLLDLENETLLAGLEADTFPFKLTKGKDPATTIKRLIVIDENVHKLYGEKLDQYLQHHNVESRVLVLPTWEENKSFELVFKVAEVADDFGINRREHPVIAIGGGVCLDICGLACNLLRRNTPVIKVPTTVMGVVDASIGVKTAVNFHGKKNKLGTYCPPLGVFYDLSFLQTLDQRNISNGSAEILKMALIKDETLFNHLEKHADAMIASNFQTPESKTAVRRSIQGMLEELEYNLYEHILVRLVDYGHTVSPEIEMEALKISAGDESMLLHGEAVTIDMALSVELACGRGLLSQGDRERVYKVIDALGLPVWHQAASMEVAVKGLEDMTRTRDGNQNFPLTHGIGKGVFVNDITAEEMTAAMKRVQSRHLGNLNVTAR